MRTYLIPSEKKHTIPLTVMLNTIDREHIKALCAGQNDTQSNIIRRLIYQAYLLLPQNKEPTE